MKYIPYCKQNLWRVYNQSQSQRLLPFCTNTRPLVEEILKLLFVITAGISVAVFLTTNAKKTMNSQPNFEAVGKAGVSGSEAWRIRWVRDLCVVPLSDRADCDMTLNAAVMCLVYEGPQNNCY